MASKRPRLQCPLCKENLSYSAVSRHTQTRSCQYTSRSSDSLDNLASDIHDATTSDQGLDSVTVCQDSLDPAELSDSSVEEQSEVELAPEIWEADSDSDNDGEIRSMSDNLKNVQFILSYFILFFQLCYRISDRGVRHLLNFISSLFLFLSTIVPNANIKDFALIFPKTIYSLKKEINFTNMLKRYCVCPACGSLYEEDKCIITGFQNSKKSLKCNFIEFPSHPQKSRRKECGMDIMKTVKIGTTYKLVPKKLYLYNSIKASIEQLASRPGFFQSCESWCELSSGDLNFMTDVYDGRLWRDWKDFVHIPGNLLLMLNIDWFRPYKHTAYSVGVLYVVVQNLPRTLRFKPENIIIVGTIPGPHEPKLTINTFLKPMIDELIELWKGTQIKAPNSTLGVRSVRVALACISSDIPATRKICGFYGFKARHGCSKCMKAFPTSGFSEATDYGGFDREMWPLRDMKTHYENALLAKNAVTKTARTAIESKVGLRYSELLRLPYFNIVRCHMIDPMHNLFLGTAKHVTTLWKGNGIMCESEFIKIQEKIDSVLVPARIGRLPGKIASAFSGFTAEQWMLWVIVYSPFV